MVDLALKNLVYDRLRFAASAFAVGIIVTLLLTQSGFLMGFASSASSTIEQANADFWIMDARVDALENGVAGEEDWSRRALNVDGVADAASAVVATLLFVEPGGEPEPVQIIAMEDFTGWGIPYAVVEGTLSDLRAGPHVIADISNGDRLGPYELGDHREVAGVPLRIVGRARETRNFITCPVLFMNLAIFRELTFSGGSGTQYVLVRLEPGADAERVREDLEARFPGHAVVSSARWALMTRKFWVLDTGIGAASVFVLLVAILVGIAIVGQTLYSATVQYSREYATLKAIGGDNRDIYRVVLKQAFVYALTGYAVGCGPPIFLQRTIEELTGARMIVTPWIALAVFVLTIALCLVAAAFSFGKVRALDPAIVLRG